MRVLHTCPRHLGGLLAAREALLRACIRIVILEHAAFAASSADSSWCLLASRARCMCTAEDRWLILLMSAHTSIVLILFTGSVRDSLACIIL
jgi:hypothetical protein